MGNTFDRDLAYILSAGGERAMDKKIRGRRGFLGRLPLIIGPEMTSECAHTIYPGRERAREK
jgi:hypothetical protein